VRIQWITLENFRSYRTLAFSPEPRLNVLTGANAQGKTNLLEALGVLLVGRSFRGSKAADLPRWESDRATIAGEIARGDVTRSLRREIERREEGGFTVTGEGCPWARAIPFAWRDLEVLSGQPQARRNFVDGFAGKIQPAHLTAHARYRRVLARRNHLLQRGGGGLEPWDEQLATLGVEIVRRRREAVAALDAETRRVYPELSGRDHEVRLEYQSALEPGIGVEGFLGEIARRRDAEIRRGVSLVGPHRDDLRIALDGRDMRSFGSRGQQRLLALGLRLAEAGPVETAVGAPPVLLLDDALSELDGETQERLLRRIARGGQAFLTTAEPSLPESGGAAWWDVKGGSVIETACAAAGGAA